jgi:hypothetical protein
MEAAERPVDLDIPIVATGRVANKTVRAQETAKPVTVGAAGRKMVGLIDDQSRQLALRLEQLPQVM